MLELRPNCEWCDKDLPPHAGDAEICSYDGAFRRDCVETRLRNVCPNCGGGFEIRPVRPQTERRPGASLRHPPAAQTRVRMKHDRTQLEDVVAAAETIPPRWR